MPESNTLPSRPSSAACVPCRRRHLQCDAVTPVCTRCRTTNAECQYVRSRRGLRKVHSRNVPSPPLDEDMPFFTTDVFSDWLDATALSASLDIPGPSPDQALFQLLDAPLPDNTLAVRPEPELVSPDVANDPMIQLYYQNFHQSHPVVIPRKVLNSTLRHLIPPYLLSIMRYIGAHYHSDPSLKQAHRVPAYSSLSDPALRDGFKIQAFLLLAIVDHAHCHEQSAHRFIQTAVNLALEIGLDRASFAREHSYGYSVLEESWRRTYWELYVVDGLLAAMRQQTPFRLYRQRANVQLPCPEKMYNSDSIIPTRQTLEDLQNNWEHRQDFSSFAYRINAVQNLGAVLELNRPLESCTESDAHIETLDAHLVSSLMALPPLHGDGYDSSSHDEMVFQAQMTLYLARIYLHHPRSDMRFASFHTHTTSACTRIPTRLHPPGEHRDLTSSPSHTHTLDLHSRKLLRAADLLSNLATLPSTITHRSPFFTCALAMCIVVHTAALLLGSASASASGKDDESLKARIQLGIGALKALGKIWPLAGSVRQQMVELYQEVVWR